ncbi:MAG: glycosyltransferase family 4 protein [Clostridium sp.]|uniref:glycosyltransferase family 4 protein n=1 Tax=Clostridium sp. TaxID=1506 RepID=UPI003996AAE8
MRNKIMFISQSNGGVARYLQMFFKYIDKKKYKVILVYPIEYIHEKNKFEKLVDYIEFVEMHREINIIKDLKSCIAISDVIKKYDPDLIYLNSSKAGALGRIANLRYKKPIIYNPHGWAFNMKTSYLKKKVYIFIERLLSKYTDYIIAISNKEKESAIVNNIANDDKVKVIFNGIDITEYDNNLEFQKNCRLNLNISEDAIVIGMVGRISDQKAPDIFIKSAYEIKKIIPNAYFIIVGDGDKLEEIKKLINSLGLEKDVLITGWIDNTFNYINSFDISMLLSRWEGFGLVLAEYMVCKKPIIATNIDAIPDLIENNVNGLLIEVDSVEECVMATINIINNEVLKNNLILNSDNIVRKKFDVKRVVKEHDYLFSNLLR